MTVLRVFRGVAFCTVLAVCGTTCHNWSLSQGPVDGAVDAAADGSLDAAVPDGGGDSAVTDADLSDGDLFDGGLTQYARVQSGMTTLSPGTVSANVAIDGVNPARSFLVFSYRGDSTQPPDLLIGGELVNSTTVSFYRAGTGGTVIIHWYVAEFADAITVQRGSVLVDTVPKNVTLSAVDVTRAFPIISVTNTDNIFGPDDFHRALITSSTNLELRAVSASQATVYWQVVEHANAAVQAGVLDLAVGVGTDTASATAFDTSKSWLLYTYHSTPGTMADQLVQGVVTNPTTLTFDRETSDATASVAWYLIEFSDDTIVQHGSRAFGRSNLQRDVNLNAVVPDQTLAAVGGMHHTGGNTDYTTDANPGVGMVTCEFTANNRLSLERAVHGDANAHFGWFVIELPIQ